MKILRNNKAAAPARRRSTSRGQGEGVRGSEQDLEQRYAFRRNRTLTGSLSSDVSSANVSNMDLKSPRVKSHHLRAHRHRLGAVLFVVILVAGSLGYVLYQFTAKSVATAVTERPIQPQVYEAIVDDYLKSHLNQRLRSILDSAQLTDYLQSHGAPEVAAVGEGAQFESIGVSKFTLVMRRPVVVWRAGETTYYVDDKGNAFKRNYFAEPAIQVVDQSGIQASDNQVLASDRFLGFIGRAIGRIQVQGYTVNKVVLPEATSRQVEVYVDGLAYPIKLSVDRSAGEQAEDMARAVRHLQGKGVTPRYIDVRVSGKAFYQ